MKPLWDGKIIHLFIADRDGIDAATEKMGIFPYIVIRWTHDPLEEVDKRCANNVFNSTRW